MSDVININTSNHRSNPVWILEYRFFINKRANLFADILLSNIVEVSMEFWTEWRGVKRVTVRGELNVCRGTFKFDNFYFNNHIEAYHINFSPFSRFKIRTPGVHYSIPPNVDLGTMKIGYFSIYHRLFSRMLLDDGYGRELPPKVYVSFFYSYSLYSLFLIVCILVCHLLLFSFVFILGCMYTRMSLPLRKRIELF